MVPAGEARSASLAPTRSPSWVHSHVFAANVEDEGELDDSRIEDAPVLPDAVMLAKEDEDDPFGVSDEEDDLVLPAAYE